jgi:hypothetical protein
MWVIESRRRTVKRASSSTAGINDAIDRVAGDTAENIAQVGFWVDVIELGGLDEGVHGGCPLAAAIGAGEEIILSADCHCPFILPMSGRRWKSITGGTRILATKLAYGGWSNDRRAGFLRSWGRLALSFPLLIGCSIPLFALE